MDFFFGWFKEMPPSGILALAGIILVMVAGKSAATGLIFKKKKKKKKKSKSSAEESTAKTKFDPNETKDVPDRKESKDDSSKIELPKF